MASSENQGLQIALVVFVILTLLFGVGTVLFYRAYDEAARKSEADVQEAQRQRAAHNAAQDQINQLLGWIGVEITGGTDADVQSASSALEEDMRHLSSTFHEERQTWRDAIAFLTTSLNDSNTRLATAEEKIRELEQINESREHIKEQQVQESVAAAAAARADLETERNEYRTQIQRMSSLQENYRERIAALETELNTTRAEHAQLVGRMSTDLNRWQAIADQRQRQIDDLTKESFEIADGEIYRVDQGKGLVWINLGTEDRVRPQIKFSVYGPDENNFERVARKGTVEVLRAIGPRMAEARILEDRFTDPILPGDKLYTPLWHAGRQEHMAVAGLIDIDGDGESDRRLVHDLIRLSGAVLDAELDDDGNESGEMSIQTRFLIVGEETERNAEALGRWKGRAQDLGVQPISVSKFLDMAGWTETKRVLRFGSGRTQDFLPPRPDGGLPHTERTLGPQFEPRRPGRQSTR